MYWITDVVCGDKNKKLPHNIEHMTEASQFTQQLSPYVSRKNYENQEVYNCHEVL
jgi:hypothetical protein